MRELVTGFNFVAENTKTKQAFQKWKAFSLPLNPGKNGGKRYAFDHKNCFCLPENMLKQPLLFILFAFAALTCQAQEFTHQDTLRGSITPERAWWDLNFYHLKIAIDPATKSLKGSNVIRYKVLQPNQVMQ